MNKSPSITLLNQLLEQDADLVLAWLKSIESGDSSPPEGFNWLGLAEAAAFNARSGSRQDSTKPNIKWAEVATKVYDRVAAKATPGIKDSLMNSSMMLRTAMIAKLGVVPGHPVLDIDSIFCWFKDSVMMSYSEAAKKAAEWRICPIEEIKELRRIKNHLRVISVLADNNKLLGNQEINSWLSLRDKLP